MVPEKIDLSEAIKECCDELSPLAEARSVELLFEPKNSICISADAFLAAAGDKQHNQKRR